MRYKSIIIAISVILLAGFCFSFSLISNTKTNDIDMVYINGIVKQAEQNIIRSDEEEYAYRIVKMDEQDYYDAINQAIKSRDTIVDLNIDNEPVGKIIFFTGFAQLQTQAQQTLILAVFITFSILLLVCIAYILYVQNTVYKPFMKLKYFAQSIATGNLDLPLNMDKGNAFGAFTESFDIMRTELKTAKHKENLANISKRELIASLSHDIKTPVASIKAVSELLLALSENEKCKPKITIIYEKAEQIDRLITDMFNATLEELGELKVSVTEQYSSILLKLVKNADYENKVHLNDIPQCIITIDVLRFGQVLDNVFANSYKYANTAIDISCCLSDTHLEMDIRDFGKGVNEIELPLIFNKFYRGSNIQAQNGSGLGLYISKYLIKKQNGDIVCFNNATGFTVKIMIKLA